MISLTLLLATVLLTGGIATWAALTHDTDPPAAPILPTEQPQPAIPSDVRGDPSQSFPAPLPIALASALCISAPSRDFGGTPFTYEPAKAVDGLPETAWRCDGDGIGQRLEISLAGRATLTRIGILPGYAKTDPYDGTDRYAQNRRISAVEYTFDDGSTVSHSFDTSVSARSLQWLSLPNISTSRIVITIRGSMPGETTGGQPPFDKVAISEVAVHGLMTPHSPR